MKEYELTVLVHPELESSLDAQLGVVRDLITSSGGEIISEDNWGKRRLAYAIAKQDFAIYVAFEVHLPAAAVQKISSTLNITDGVLRYLIVSVNDTIRKKREAARKQSAEEESEE